jgi:hypothetical protein
MVRLESEEKLDIPKRFMAQTEQVMYEDKSFPHDKFGDSFDPKKEKKITSKRATDMEGISFFGKGHDDNDQIIHTVNQGALGDCWFMVGLASVCEDVNRCKNLFKHQTKEMFERGMVVVTLHKDGREVDVVMDDYLPVSTYYGKDYSKYAGFNAEAGYAAAFVEKAAAKVWGNY